MQLQQLLQFAFKYLPCLILSAVIVASIDAEALWVRAIYVLLGGVLIHGALLILITTVDHFDGRTGRKSTAALSSGHTRYESTVAAIALALLAQQFILTR